MPLSEPADDHVIRSSAELRQRYPATGGDLVIVDTDPMDRRVR